MSIFCIDFDGTIVTHEYPEIGKPVPHAIDVMKKLISNGNKIILYTMRSGFELGAAEEYLEKAGISLYGVNKNPTQSKWTKSPKVFAHTYIDDAALGCPLIDNEHFRPYVDWVKIESLLKPWLIK